MIIFGKQLFLHILDKHSQKFRAIYLSKELDKTLFARIAKLGLKIQKID